MKYLIIALFTLISLISLTQLGLGFNDRFFLIGIIGFTGAYLSVLWLVSPQATQATPTQATYPGARDGDSVTH